MLRLCAVVRDIGEPCQWLKHPTGIDGGNRYFLEFFVNAEQCFFTEALDVPERFHGLVSEITVVGSPGKVGFYDGVPFTGSPVFGCPAPVFFVDSNAFLEGSVLIE